jgi:hypothetical protein
MSTFGSSETPFGPGRCRVELDEEVAGYPDGEEVDRRPADDLVGRSWMAKKA